MNNGVTILLHFLTFTCGFTALILFLKRSTLVSQEIRQSFILQALYYNLTIIFMAIQDFTNYFIKDAHTCNTFPFVFKNIANSTNHIFVILWYYSFILLVYSLLGTKVNIRMKRVLALIGLLLFVSITSSFIARIFSVAPWIIRLNLWVICYSIVVILAYSIYLLIKSRRIGNEKRQKSLLIFSILFIVYSSFDLACYFNLFQNNGLHFFHTRSFVNTLDFLFNSFLFIWAFTYFDYLEDKLVNQTPIKLSPEQIMDRYQISKREFEVIQLVCAGKSNQEIADVLFISLGTVKSHMYNIFLKLEVKNRTQLVKLF
jgi:DNA-binding CsgD family transcriptional regulator